MPDATSSLLPEDTHRAIDQDDQVTDIVHLRDVARGMRRLWLIPLVLAFAGLTVGLTAASRVPPVYRSQATVLVGPTDGVVTQTATVRASEDLANFYADMVRRQIILEPVTRQLALAETWPDLRDHVSAKVPPENLRLVTVTVTDDEQASADAIADALARQLVSLSPAVPAGDSQAFINEQLDRLRKTIEDSQHTIDRLQAAAGTATDREAASSIEHQVVVDQRRLSDLQRAYVELMSAEPTSDAGGLTVLDQASPIAGSGRSGTLKLAVVDAFAGAGCGLVVAWTLYRRRGARHAEDAGGRRAPTDSLRGLGPSDVGARPDPSAGGDAPQTSAPQRPGKPTADAREVLPSRHGYGSVTNPNGRVAGTRTGPLGELSRAQPRNGAER